MLFIIVMEALSNEFRFGSPCELLYADDLVIAAETPEELTQKFTTLKEGLESHGLRVNMGKIKFLHRTHVDNRPPKETGKFHCRVCRLGVGRNSIYCGQCKRWIHKVCTDIKGKLKDYPNFVCKMCRKQLPPSPEPQIQEFTFNGEQLDVVPTFCYLGDMIGHSGVCKDATTARVKSAWKNFREPTSYLHQPAPTAAPVQKLWPHIQLLRPKCHASCKWYLANHSWRYEALVPQQECYGPLDLLQKTPTGWPKTTGQTISWPWRLMVRPCVVDRDGVTIAMMIWIGAN